MSILAGTEIGMERIAREALVTLVNELNDAIDVEDAKWASLDAELANKLGLPFRPCKTNHVRKDNFYMGHRPSLIEADFDYYPNVAVMIASAVKGADPLDQLESNRLTMWIEAMAVDGPYTQKHKNFEREAEDLVNRKVQRMAEAIHAVLNSNRTFGGVIFEIEGISNASVSNCERRRNPGGSGDEFYWQMLRLEYTINKISLYQ